jgi:hypothetical protein
MSHRLKWEVQILPCPKRLFHSVWCAGAGPAHPLPPRLPALHHGHPQQGEHSQVPLPTPPSSPSPPSPSAEHLTCWKATRLSLATISKLLNRFLFFLNVLYSTLLHLPPLRFHCVGGCWDRTQDFCDFGIGSQTL